MTADAARGRAAAAPESTETGSAGRLLAVRLIAYATNYVVARIPSFQARRWWYERVLGMRIAAGAGIHLGCHVWFYGPGQIRRDGLVLGRNSRVNRDCCLDARGGIAIGDAVSISPEVVILTASHGVQDPEFRVETRPVVIEDNVWVGTRAMIMPGVTLGHGCVVSAGAVVTRDVPPLTIVGGVPAKPIGSRDAQAARYSLDGGFPLFE